MEISVLIQCLNEESRLEKLFAPLKEIKDIVFVDHGSTDKSIELAKSLGARVYPREFIHDVVTEDDVSDFKNRFNYEPQFTVGEKIVNAKMERTESQKLCKNDWVLNPDCDEIVTWDYMKILEMLPHFDCINCKFFHERNPDGTRKSEWTQTTKLYNRTRVFWISRIHEVLDGYDTRVGWTNDMEIDHYPTFREYKKRYMNHMEYAVLRDQNIRSFYYLGVEYHHWKQWEKAIRMFTLYLRESYYVPEKVMAYVKIADSFWELGKEDEAYIYAMQGLKLNPKSSDVWNLLSKIAPRRDQAVWQKHAEISEDDHLL